MVLRLRGGGKVHGSLARAGKVKGQTPKVDKQEKAKTPRGRAKKRMLYTRRFVNNVVGPGTVDGGRGGYACMIGGFINRWYRGIEISSYT